MYKRILLAATVILAGCSSTKPVATPTQSDVDRVSSKYPNFTLVQLNEGRSLFQKHCSVCHGLKDPASKDEAQWNKTVPRMAAKANKKSTVIDAEAQELILKYVVTMSDAKPVK